jgi:hypothetical protein
MWTQISYVNQTTFLGKRPGSLLYMGPSARQYTPSFPTYLQDPFVDATVFLAEKLCDITFGFQYTTRRAKDPPDLESVRGSWVADGWNSMPYAHSGDFYVVTRASASDGSPGLDWIPTFKSAPMQLLFSCPEPG